MGPYVLPEFAYGTVGPSILSLRFLNLESESEKYCNSHHFYLLLYGTVVFTFGTVYVKVGPSWDRMFSLNLLMGPSILTIRFLKLESESEKNAIVIIFSYFLSGTVVLTFRTVM